MSHILLEYAIKSFGITPVLDGCTIAPFVAMPTIARGVGLRKLGR